MQLDWIIFAVAVLVLLGAAVLALGTVFALVLGAVSPNAQGGSLAYRVVAWAGAIGIATLVTAVYFLGPQVLELLPAWAAAILTVLFLLYLGYLFLYHTMLKHSPRVAEAYGIRIASIPNPTLDDYSHPVLVRPRRSHPWLIVVVIIAILIAVSLWGPVPFVMAAFAGIFVGAFVDVALVGLGRLGLSVDRLRGVLFPGFVIVSAVVAYILAAIYISPHA